MKLAQLCVVSCSYSCFSYRVELCQIKMLLKNTNYHLNAIKTNFVIFFFLILHVVKNIIYTNKSLIVV